MFDPTIFDNLKVVVEGAVYDLDLQGKIVITNRTDQIDMAHLSRFYALTFRSVDSREDSVHGELRIYAGAYDLSAEILEKSDASIGCYLEVGFYTKIKNPERDCPFIEQALLEVWGSRPSITQRLSYLYHSQPVIEWDNAIDLKFERKIGEEQVEDLPIIVNYIVKSMKRLSELFD